MSIRPALPMFGLSLLASFTLAGCATSGTSNSSSPTSPPVASAKSGQVMGGEQPVVGASIQLYAAGATADGSASTPLLTSAVTTDATGSFTITGAYTCPSPGSLVFVTATGGNPGIGHNNPALALLTALGPCGSLSSSTFIQIDERTTVAAIAALAPFMRSANALGSSSIDATALANAFTLANALVNSASGQIPGPSLPANAAAPVPTINSLANILAACVNSSGGVAGDGTPCGTLFAATTPTGGIAPSNTVSAALNLMRDPATNAGVLFSLSSAAAPFQPQLSSAPTDWTVALSGPGAPAATPAGCTAPDLTGSAAFTNYTLQQPQVCRKLLASDLPAPNLSASVTNNSVLVAPTPNQMPIVPPGFKVTLYSGGFGNARYLLAEPNGDLLLAEPGVGAIVTLRGVDANGVALHQWTYASGLTSPYGMAFFPSAANPQSLYVANTSSIVRFPFAPGDVSASAPPTTLATDIPASGGHTTRALAFTQEATPRLLVSVGSATNVTDTDTDPGEFHRADILAYSTDGVFQSIYASGLRNPVGLTLDSAGRVWTSVNERDGLGDNVPADYVTHVQEGGFYGWPWSYNGANLDPRLGGKHQDLASTAIVADTLLQPHFAPLQIAFYTGTQFPTPYRGDLFVASHGSWNKSVRGGYELLRVRMVNGVATGDYEDFMTGFVNPDGTVWGRPAGVAVGADGALYVADDGSNSIWRITYAGQ